MTYDSHLIALPWSDYELLDSGDLMKLERFGEVIIARPETQALWKKLRPELWGSAHAEFAFHDKKGSWTMRKSVPESWELAWNEMKFLVRLTGFKHTGVFPEQAPNWEWVKDHVRTLSERQELARKQSGRPEGGDPSLPAQAGTFSQEAAGVSVLNLFGYTGIASLVAAQAGAFVTHVDASKQSLDWAHENAQLSGISEDKIRWVLDDALAFVKREARRGIKYEGIILDPPAFGRGAKGEVWKIEEDLQTLLETLKELLSDKSGSFFLLNGYAAGYAPRSFAQAVESVFLSTSLGAGGIQGECGELFIQETKSERVIPAGIYVRFVR